MDFEKDFEKLFNTRPHNRAAILEFTEKYNNPHVMIEKAIDQFDKHGNDDRLVLADELLMWYGMEAISVLSWLSHTNYIEYFIPTLFLLCERYKETHLDELIDILNNCLRYNYTREPVLEILDHMKELKIEVSKRG